MPLGDAPAPWSLNPSEAGRCAAELVACGSIEMGSDRPEEAHCIAQFLPSGARVYINHTSRQKLADVLAAAIAVRDAGLDPVIHVAARRITGRGEITEFLEQAARLAKVNKILLIGGDSKDALGPYKDAAAVLRERFLASCGMSEIGFASYPEGHPSLSAPILRRALEEKLDLAAKDGLGTYIVTQFSFAPTRITECCLELSRTAPDVPVYVGLVGPTNPRVLLKYAQRCGVSASLRGLMAQGMGAVRLFTHTDPGEQLTVIARYCLARDKCNVVGAHFFSFGGVSRTAEWMNARINARLDMHQRAK
jgi:methylenetetrahydrofolate reductase (NADPH)